MIHWDKMDRKHPWRKLRARLSRITRENLTRSTTRTLNSVDTDKFVKAHTKHMKRPRDGAELKHYQRFLVNQKRIRDRIKQNLKRDMERRVEEEERQVQEAFTTYKFGKEYLNQQDKNDLDQAKTAR